MEKRIRVGTAVGAMALAIMLAGCTVGHLPSAVAPPLAASVVRKPDTASRAPPQPDTKRQNAGGPAWRPIVRWIGITHAAVANGWYVVPHESFQVMLEAEEADRVVFYGYDPAGAPDRLHDGYIHPTDIRPATHPPGEPNRWAVNAGSFAGTRMGIYAVAENQYGKTVSPVLFVAWRFGSDEKPVPVGPTQDGLLPPSVTRDYAQDPDLLRMARAMPYAVLVPDRLPGDPVLDAAQVFVPPPHPLSPDGKDPRNCVLRFGDLIIGETDNPKVSAADIPEKRQVVIDPAHHLAGVLYNSGSVNAQPQTGLFVDFGTVKVTLVSTKLSDEELVSVARALRPLKLEDRHP